MVEVYYQKFAVFFFEILILGTKADYEITWFDPKGPTMHHPDMNDPYTDRYCNGMMMTDYKGDPEPTRQTKNGETEDCVSFVFLPQQNSRGQICMADDYCSTEMSYICELSTYQSFDEIIKRIFLLCFVYS